MGSRIAVVSLAFVVVGALAAPTAGAHDEVSSAAGHAAEDAVVHTVAQERALDAHTLSRHGADAKAAAAAVAGAPQDVGQWGPVVDWPVVGVHVALLPNGKVLAYDSVGDNATESYPVQDHTRATVWDPRRAARRPSTSTRASTSSAAGWRTWSTARSSLPAETRIRAQRHRPDPPLRPGDEHVEPGTEHGGRALVSVGDAVAQRRDADHLGPCRHAGGADAQRRAANAEHGIAEPAAVSMDGRRAGRPGVLFGPRPDAASARHDRHRHMADAPASATRSTATTAATRSTTSARCSSPAAVRRRPTRASSTSTPQPRVTATAPMAYGRRQHNLTVLADGMSWRPAATFRRRTRRPQRRRLPRRAVESRNRAMEHARGDADYAPVSLDRTAAARRARPVLRRRVLRHLRPGGLPSQERGDLLAPVPVPAPPTGTLAPRPAIDSAPPTATTYGAQFSVATADPAVHPQGRPRPARRRDPLRQHGAALHPAGRHPRNEPALTATAPAQRQYRAAPDLHAVPRRCQRRPIGGGGWSA